MSTIDNNMIIIGEKIQLRSIAKSDTPLIVKWRNNPKVRDNFIYREKFTEEGHNHWMDTKVKSGEVVQFVIEDSKTERPVGSVFLRDVDYKNKKAEYGIFIGEDDARGQGFGTEAAKLICEYGFEQMNLHKIILRVFSYNEQAIKSYEHAGFEREAYLKDEVYIDDSYYDIILMAKFAK